MKIRAKENFNFPYLYDGETNWRQSLRTSCRHAFVFDGKKLRYQEE
jgi:hypothetical protein